MDKGGQGTVYRGTVDGEPAAIKVYNPGQTMVRVDREIAALNRLNSPVIAGLLWSGELNIGTEETRAVATRFVDGTPLNVLLSRRRLSDEEIGALIYDVATAIHSLWQIRIVHRDLKPSNIIHAAGRATVIDLGLARHVDQSSLTIAGATWGTVGYLSPEQMRAEKQLTCKSDVFSLAIVAVQCALRRHPTGGDQLRLIATRLCEGLPTPANALPMAALLQRMLAMRPTRRPTPEQILAELDAYKR